MTLTSGPTAGDRGFSFDLAGGTIDTGSFVWLVPAATFTAPGLLLLLWIALQAGGALAWAPAIRRLRRGGLIPGRAAARQSAATPS